MTYKPRSKPRPKALSTEEHAQLVWRVQQEQEAFAAMAAKVSPQEPCHCGWCWETLGARLAGLLWHYASEHPALDPVAEMRSLAQMANLMVEAEVRKDDQ